MYRRQPPVGRGWFITIEGPDGAGKTTQGLRVAARLEADGLMVHLTREPGGTRLGERLREMLLTRTSPLMATDPLTDALLFNAARSQLVREVIWPTLEAGTTVVCGRFADSTIAYQGYGSGVPIKILRSLADIATGGLVPDLTILLDLPVDVGLARKVPEDVTRFETDFDLAFHQRVRAGFLDIAATDSARFIVVDAGGAEEAVAAEISAALDRWFTRPAVAAAASEPEAPPVRTI